MAGLIARNLKMLMLAVIALAVTAQAQSTRVIRVRIPFEFDLGQQSFPAGEYTVLQPGEHLLVLRNSEGRTVAQQFTQEVESNTPPDTPKLTFRLSYGRYRLSEVWQQEESSGERLAPPKLQVKVAQRQSIEDHRTGEGGGQP